MQELLQNPEHVAFTIITIAILITVGFFLARFGFRQLSYQGGAVAISTTCIGTVLLLVGIIQLMANVQYLLIPAFIAGAIYLYNR